MSEESGSGVHFSSPQQMARFKIILTSRNTFTYTHLFTVNSLVLLSHWVDLGKWMFKAVFGLQCVGENTFSNKTK